MNIKGAIFDMDGTLVESLGIWNYFYEQIGNKYLGKPIEVSTAFDKSVRTVTLCEAAEMMQKEFGIKESSEEIYKYAQNLLLYYYERNVSLKEGAIEYLEYLRQNNVKMCLASATEKADVERCLKRFGIDKYFDCVISCCEVGRSKAFPDIFIAAQKSLGTAMNETWVFEDSLGAIKTASKAGFKTVGIFDKFNYGHDEMKQIADIYVGENQTLTDLVSDR